jgi:hypothetical protein
LIEVDEGRIKQKQERTEYNRLYDEFAKRTHDESGDYVVRGWNLLSRENLNTGSNEGLLTLEEGGDADLISLGIESGLAYVKGYEIETYGTRYISTPKSKTFKTVNNQFSFIQSGKYTEINEISGLPEADTLAVINLYDTVEKRVTNGISYTNSPVGTKIGEARVASLIHDSGQLGQADATIKLYISDIVMFENRKFTEVRSIQNDDFFADTVLVNDQTILQDTEGVTRLNFLGTPFVRNVKDQNGVSDTSFIFNRQITQSFNASGVGTFTVSIANESFPYGTGTLQSLSKETLLLSIDDETQVQLSGTLHVTNGNTAVTGSATEFNNLNEGDRLIIDSSVFNIRSIANNTFLELDEPATSSGNFDAVKVYLKGDIIDLQSKGADNGQERNVTATTESLTINLNETLSSSSNFKLTTRVLRSSVQEISKTLKPNRYVIIDASSSDSLNTFSLGFSDVYQIRQVRKNNSPFTSVEDGTDVTLQFILNNGQTIDSYQTSFITTDNQISNNDYLLVELDYFEPDFSSGVGYFSIDSYPIDDENESNETIKTIDMPVYTDPLFGKFELRDVIDTRPIKSNTANDATTLQNASVNPDYSDTFILPTNGLRLPLPGINISYDYSYFIPRRDVLGVDREGNFVVLQGEPSETPAFPRLSETYMPIAKIEIPPFPSISGTLGRILDKKDKTVKLEKITTSRSTMRDIENMENRIQNLEYYNSLNLLEKNTLDLIIPDENGLDRLKNGVFVDPFVDHSLAQNNSNDYKISIDRNAKEIKPTFELEGFDSTYKSGTNLQKIGDLIMLDHEETVLIDQPFATTRRNVELTSYRYIGDLKLDPEIDTWSDVNTVDNVIKSGVDIPTGKIVSTEWGSWSNHNTGAISGRNEDFYRVFFREDGQGRIKVDGQVIQSTDRQGRGISENTLNRSPTLIGTFSTMSDAKQAAQSQSRAFIVTGGEVTETIENSRTGIEKTVTVDETKEELGSFVTDVSLVPYIRPQSIRLYAQGLKPNTEFFVFFDGENVNSFVTPAKLTNENFSDLNNLGNEGDKITSDQNGDVIAFLRIPDQNKRFRVGTKEIVITDNPTNSFSIATSYAKSNFYSAGLSLQKKDTVLSTRSVTDVSEKKVTQTRTETRTTNQPISSQSTGGSCLAYSFYVDEPEEVEGIYLTSLDVYMQQLHPELGVNFSIREMSNDGGVKQNDIPFSNVWMKRSDPRLKISEDGISNPTNVNFDSPVFLYNKTQYAFRISAEALNPDTYVWVSELGGTDVATDRPVTSRGLNGTLFTTNNNLNWDIVPDVDLKCTFYRANFDTSVDGIATIINEDLEFIQANNDFASTFFNIGEPVKGSDILQLSLDGANTVAVDDTIVDLQTGAEAKVVSISGTEVFTDNHGFLTNSNIEVFDSENNIKETGIITTIDFGLGVVRKVERDQRKLIIEKSNGKFFLQCNIRSILPDRHTTVPNAPENGLSYTNITKSNAVSPFINDSTLTLPNGQPPESSGDFPNHTVENFYIFNYTNTHFRPGYINHENNTSIKFTYRGVKDSQNTDKFNIKPFVDYEFNQVHNILSRSQENALLNGEKSVKIEATLSSSNDLLSPYIDTSLLGSVYIMNQLNDDISQEHLAKGGSLQSKYLSKIVTLDEQNEAEDLIVFNNEYRPATTDVQVWGRFKSKYDPENILDKQWILLSSTKTAVSSSENDQNFIDTQYTIPEQLKTGQFGEFEYVSGDGNTYTGYSQFQIKIGMIGENPAVYPKAAQLRAIALQV